MKIESPAFKNNSYISSKYTCDGENISPALIFSDVPEEAKSLVLIVEDPDVPESVRADKLWTHWIVWDLPPGMTELKADEEITNGIEGKNSSGNPGYEGPCPPDGEHRYYFSLFALDTLLKLPAETDRLDVENAMRGHIIGKAELMAKYKK